MLLKRPKETRNNVYMYFGVSDSPHDIKRNRSNANTLGMYYKENIQTYHKPLNIVTRLFKSMKQTLTLYSCPNKMM